jgi:hypothetical protein
MADIAYTQTIHGLIRKRSEISGELSALKEQMDRLMSQLDALDVSLRVFRPEIDMEALPGPKMPRLNVAFRGEVLRYCADLFRQAEGPLTTEEIAVSVMRARRLDVSNADLRRTMTHRIGSTLRDMRAKGYIRDVGKVEGSNMKRWEVVG